MRLTHTKYAINGKAITISVTCRGRDEARFGDVTLQEIIYNGVDISDAIDALTDIEQVLYGIDWEQEWAETVADQREYLAILKSEA